MTASIRRPLWICPRCGRSFANLNQTHTCASLGDLARHFGASTPEVRETFDRIVEIVEAIGPVEVLPERTRIALYVRMSFAAFVPRAAWLDGHLVLARRIEDPRFRSVEVFSPRNLLHAFRLSSVPDVDARFAAWLAEAHAVGAQEHLAGREPSAHAAVDDAVAAELLRLELALAERDRVGLLSGFGAVIDEPFLEFGASGRRWDRGSILEALDAEPGRRVEIESFVVRRLSDDLALATYVAVVGSGSERHSSERTSVWRRSRGSWRIAFHQGTALLPPEPSPASPHPPGIGRP